MELAMSALSRLLPKLATLLRNEYKLQKGVRGEIRFLEAEMESMQAALNRLSMLPAHQIDDLVMIWVRDLKELVYDIEDSVDTFMVRVHAPVHTNSHSFRRFFDRTIGLLTKITNRHHIADDILEIKRRVQDVAGRRERYKFGNVLLQPDNTAMDPRLPALYEDAKNLVGIEGPARKLTALLLDGNGEQKQQLLVVSIVGIGGLGKTTLANSVYQRLKGGFQSQAFVSVSLKPDIKKILSSILRQVGKFEYLNAEAWKDTEIIDQIRQILEEKRYIIVIDDVWEESAWTQIKCCLFDNHLGSRVIVTTRNACVAKLCCSPIDGARYELDPVSETDSKRLFCQRIFNKDEEIQPELMEVSMKILKKCGGVPLAIITIASLLASTTNKTKYEWDKVYRSMGSGLEKDKTMKNMREILYLSYNDLPSYLKPCLLYLCIFPEDYKIKRDWLVQIWIAEGFVDENQGKNLYELGDRYFVELANRTLIQPIEFDINGSATCCRVHDMILDLITSISAEENFVTILEVPQLKIPDFKRRCRRLSLQGRKGNHCEVVGSKDKQVILPEMMDMSHVRTLIGFGDVPDCVPPLSRFSVLRVLVLKYFPRKNNHPRDLGNLYNLRYLELGGMLEKELIEQIGKLQLLKTLDLCEASIRELPVRTAGMSDLEKKIRNLMSQQDLSKLNDEEASPNTMAGQGELTELRVLKIDGSAKRESYMKTFLKNLSNLGLINVLHFCGTSTYSLDCISDEWIAPAHTRIIVADQATICQVPRWFSSLMQLSCLSIQVDRLKQDDLRLLGALPMLRFLWLEVAFGGPTDKELVIGTDRPFSSLAEFTFKHSTRCFLVFTPGVMPKLKRLELYFEVLKRQGCIDIGLENLPSLEHVTVIGDCDGATILEVEDVKNKFRQAIVIHPNHPFLLMSGDFEDPDDLESLEERNAFYREKELLKHIISMAKEDVTSTSEAGHAANPLDQPSPNFSLANFIELSERCRKAGMATSSHGGILPVPLPTRPPPVVGALFPRAAGSPSIVGSTSRYSSAPLLLQPTPQPAMPEHENNADERYAEANIRDAADMHLNHPIVELLSPMKHKMVTEESTGYLSASDGSLCSLPSDNENESHNDDEASDHETRGASEAWPPLPPLCLLAPPHQDENEASQSSGGARQ